jgi:hypothetical protein
VASQPRIGLDEIMFLQIECIIDYLSVMVTM